MASTSQEAQNVDATYKKIFHLLHSSDPNSATELRLMFDEIAVKEFGPEVTLTSMLSSRTIELEKCFPGRAKTPPLVPEQSAEVVDLTAGPSATLSDSSSGDEPNVVHVNLKEFGDLNCCACGEMVYTATNRLIECSSCGALYHQECHIPPISDEAASEDQKLSWQCHTCLSQSSTSKATAESSAVISLSDDEPMPSAVAKAALVSSHSSTSSSSSSPFHKPELPTTSGRPKSKAVKEELPTSTSKSCEVGKKHSSSASSTRRSAHSTKRTSSSKAASSSSSRHRENASTSSGSGRHKSHK